MAETIPSRPGRCPKTFSLPLLRYETIAREATGGKEVSGYFDASKGRMVYPAEGTADKKVAKESRRPTAA
jgi:hypothetical protein